MTKLYSEKRGNAAIASGNSCENSVSGVLEGKFKLPASESLRNELLRFVYLVLSLSGLCGTLYIIYIVISMPSVNSIHMIMVFLLSCVPLAVMVAGLYGLSRLSERPDRY